MAPLVQAAVDGRLVLLEGIHRADIGTIAVLQRCIVCMCVFFAVLCVATSFVYAYPSTQYVLLWCLCIDIHTRMRTRTPLVEKSNDNAYLEMCVHH